MSGKRAKMRYFPYIKQNSIAEIVSTMELFLVAEVGFEPHDLRVMRSSMTIHLAIDSLDRTGAVIAKPTTLPYRVSKNRQTKITLTLF